MTTVVSRKLIIITYIEFETLSSCFLINLDFLQPNVAHFDNNIVLQLLVFETLGFMFPVFFFKL